MRLDLKIHSLNHILKAILGYLEYSLWGIHHPKEELIVINYHGTPSKFIGEFEKQIIFFVKHFHIIDPAELEGFYSSGIKSEKLSLLLTFDDGLKNNLKAVEILQKHNIKALFFVIPDFVDTPVQLQKEYYLKNIRPVINPETDSETEDYISMDWEDLKRLLDMGHKVGSHTSTHTLEAKNPSLEQSIYEIEGSKMKIAKKLNIGLDSLDSYCSPNDTLLSTGKKELELIGKNYSYHFTTIPGSNFSDKNPLFIKRSNIESFWLFGAVLYSAGKLDRFRWASKRRAMHRLEHRGASGYTKKQK